LAQRLLGTDEQDLLAAPRRPRKRWLAAAAAVLLTLGAAGTWGVVTAGVYAFGPLPKIAAFAPPEPPAIVARPLGVTVNGVAIEPEPARISTQLVDPYFLRPLVAPAPGVSQQRRAVVSELPEYELPSVTAAPSSAAQPGALDALAPRPVAPAKAPPKPVAAEPQRPVGGVVKPPRLIEQAPIAYPAMARAARVEGAVVIDARVDETGRVVQMRVVSGHALLHQAAQESLRHWRYEPGTLNGQPTAMHVYVTIQFRR
jgi:TonB family protein